MKLIFIGKSTEPRLCRMIHRMLMFNIINELCELFYSDYVEFSIPWIQQQIDYNEK
jgi:hypothetical protein